ncbi:MAG TPA: CDP-2,3-bis-(O-geranylgeranyl)-sn-glycerol synthase [Candidatus Norongarragalinales archaeon]|jgi:CDP-2,3-bis-(O-geranylgeranyl)-sn-glycerol synthase|nr:CDP-2,3-bis-(O-geranylgeranyl)-sn-glycerol synthase [Candidatus Norongarragalinales archaeon]
MDFVRLVALIFPAYVANALPVVVQGRTPLDLGMKFTDGRPLFGPGKTVRGTTIALIGGTAMGIIEALLIPDLFLPQLSLASKIIAGFLLAVGTMAGDVFGSFVKRRLNIAQGGKFLWDKLLFLIVALIFASPFYTPTVEEFLFLLVLTYLLHAGLNRAANLIGLKRVPW